MVRIRRRGEPDRFDVSPTLIHPQITLCGSWVTSIGHMDELVEHLVRWKLHPEVMVSHRLALENAAEAHRVAEEAQSGKVCSVVQ